MSVSAKKAKLIYWEYLPILLLVLISLTIGLATVKRYGESWDEESLYSYADQVLIAYGNALGITEETPTYSNLTEQYGPVVMVVTKLVHKTILPAWLISEVNHLVNFLCFQIGVIALFGLSRRWLNQWAAFGVMLLFISQPLLWGHAFINPKDIPFMSFFTLLIYLGFRAVDQLSRAPKKKSGLAARQRGQQAHLTPLVF